MFSGPRAPASKRLRDMSAKRPTDKSLSAKKSRRCRAFRSTAGQWWTSFSTASPKGFSPSTSNWRFTAFNRAAEDIFQMSARRGDRKAAVGGVADGRRQRVRAPLPQGNGQARKAGVRDVYHPHPRPLARGARVPARRRNRRLVPRRDRAPVNVRTAEPARTRTRAGSGDRRHRRHARRAAAKGSRASARRSTCASMDCPQRPRSKPTTTG